MVLGAISIKVHGDTSVVFTTGIANDNHHLDQAKHKLDIGQSHQRPSSVP